MMTFRLIVLLTLFYAPWLVAGGASSMPLDASREQLWTFDDVPVGQLPRGWRVEETHPDGPPATWEVIEDNTAPSGGHALALTKTSHSGETFNLCWTDKVYFMNGGIEVRMRPNAGREDQGGGIIWRVQDKNNYYVCRFNPLENNFRVYFVRDGKRRLLASKNVRVPPIGWHSVKILHWENRIKGFLNGEPLLEVTDSTISRPGGVGLWTKADAQSAFDDFRVFSHTQQKKRN